MKAATKAKKRRGQEINMLRDSEQLYLVKPADGERKAKITVIPIDSSSPAQRERSALENKYREVFEHRLDWRRLVTYVPNKELPVYNWFKYKEGFSRELVVRLFKEFGLQKRDIVFDPFAGCGTTLLAAGEFDLQGLGIDILPTSVFVARAKLTDWPNLDLLLESVQSLLAKTYAEPKQKFPDVRIINLAFDWHSIRKPSGRFYFLRNK
jgi:hypothetical protein